MNRCLQKKYFSQSKNWISRIKFAEARQKNALRTSYCNMYSYAANNPVRYFDPDGKKLFVCGTKEYMAKVQNELTKLCPGARINFDTGEVTLNSNNRTSKGYMLLFALINSEKTNTIWLGNSKKAGNSCVGYSAKICMEDDSLYGIVGKGSQNSLINFNPDDWIGGKDDEGTYLRPPYVGLAHEMGHSEAHNNGTQEYGVYMTGDGYMPSGYTPFSEINSIKWENAIRNEHRLTPRTYYYPVIIIYKE